MTTDLSNAETQLGQQSDDVVEPPAAASDSDTEMHTAENEDRGPQAAGPQAAGPQASVPHAAGPQQQQQQGVAGSTELVGLFVYVVSWLCMYGCANLQHDSLSITDQPVLCLTWRYT